jgi:hypothetical protein
LKLDCPCSASTSSSELEITEDVSFIEKFEERIKSVEEDSQNYLLKDPYEEQIQTYLPIVPKTLTGYLNGGANPTTELNTLFHYFDTGVFVFRKTVPIIPMLEINKGSNTIQIGDYNNNHPETDLLIGGKKLYLKSESNNIQMLLGSIGTNFEYNQTQISIGDGTSNTIIEHGYQLRFDENRDFLIQRIKKDSNEVDNRLFFSSGLNFRNVLDNLEISKSGSDIPTALEKIIIPYGTDLTDLNNTLTSLENKTNCLTIDNNGIKFVNPSDSEMKIIIPYGTTIPENFFINSDTYLPTIPKYLFTYSDTGNPISTLFSLFNFFNDGKDRNAGVRVLTRDNTDFLLALNENDNTAQLQLGSCINFENEVNVGERI